MSRQGPANTPSLPVPREDEPVARSSPIGRPELACIRPLPRALERLAHTIVPPSYRGAPVAERPLGLAVRWVPKRLAVGTEALGLDHLSAFVLLHVDGVSDIGEIAYSSGIPEAEVAVLLEELRRRGAVRFEEACAAPPESVVPAATVSEVRVVAVVAASAAGEAGDAAEAAAAAGGNVKRRAR